MKLISTKIHDYYDCCINQYGYQTDGNVFIREPQDIQVKIHLPKTNEHLGFLLTSLRLRYFTSRNSKGIRYLFKPFKVLVAGKIYGAIQVGVESQFSNEDNTIHYLYSYDQLMTYADINGFKIIDNEKLSRWNLISESGRTTKQNLINHFDVVNCMKECIEYKLVIAIINRIGYNSGGINVQLNCDLKKVQFYKVMDAFTIYQEISMYVDGCLSSPGNQIIEVEDKYKIEGHGFDRYSFKKTPIK